MPEIVSKYIECVIYRVINGEYQFLCLKRNSTAKVHPGIWQIVTAKIDEGEKAFETAKREVTEESGLKPVKFFAAPSFNSFYDYQRDSINLIPVFIAEVNPKDEVKISYEHSEYEWLSYEDAFKRLHWGNQKERLEEIYKYLTSQELYKTLTRIP